MKATFLHLVSFCSFLLICLSGFANSSNVNPSPAATCPTALFSYTATGINAAVMNNQQQPAGVVMRLTNGGYMRVSPLAANVSTGNLRFVEKLTSNGNVREGGGSVVPKDRASTNQSVAYFNRTYGPYTLVNPALSGVISETFTPYIDQNNNGQFDAATECLGQPAVLVYVVGDVCPTPFFSYTATGTNAAVMNNQTSPASVTMTLCNGGLMLVSPLLASLPTRTIRFVEKLTSNGNVRDGWGQIIPVDRAPTNQSVDYFDRSYGPYTLVDPTMSGVISETFTPYIDLNNDGYYNADTECLGEPAVLVYAVSNSIRTVQSGLWDQASTWTCARSPMSNDQVIIEHAVTIPQGGFTQSYWLYYGTTGSIRFSAGAQHRSKRIYQP